MIMMRGVFTALKKTLSQQTLRQAVSFNHKFITFNRGLDTHLGKHLYNSLCPVAFLVGKTSYACNPASSLTECCQNGNYREEIRTVGCIHRECLERRALNRNRTFIAIELRETCTSIHQYIHNRKISLERSRIQTFHLYLSEDGSRHEEVGSSTPVPFKINVGSLESLSALYLEHNLGTKGPVAS